MARVVLKETACFPEAERAIAAFHAEVVKEVNEAVTRERVVVIGMAQNVFVKKARKALDAAGISYKYLEYGNYFSQWKQRLAVKMWSGWPTYPQVFADGKLIGGFTETEKRIADKTLRA